MARIIVIRWDKRGPVPIPVVDTTKMNWQDWFIQGVLTLLWVLVLIIGVSACFWCYLWSAGMVWVE